MEENGRNPKVEFFFRKAKQWQEEFEELRMIIFDCGLTEELKWGCPCYTFQTGTSVRTPQKSNIVLIHGFKNYCAVLFIKGALLKDAKKILIQQTENVQLPRQIRFTHVSEIRKMKTILKAYIQEAIEVEKGGVKGDTKKKTELIFPEEFQTKLNSSSALKTAFEALTPGRQRAYNLYFSAAKQSKTKEARIEKCIPDILIGKGLNDA